MLYWTASRLSACVEVTKYLKSELILPLFPAYVQTKTGAMNSNVIGIAI